MGNLSAAMAEYMERPDQSLLYGLKIAFHDGVRYYSDVALCSRLGGFHEPLVLDWGKISDAAADRTNRLQISDWRDLKIADPDGEWIVRGEKNELKGCTVQLTYRAKDIDTADFLVRFQGILLDWQAADGVITVQCGPTFMLQLISHFPHVRLTLTDFPDLPDEFVNMYAPLAYGRHDSWAFGKALRGSGDGQVVPIYVGEYTGLNLADVEVTGSKYIICIGQIKRIIMVYRNGTPITPGFATGNWEDQAIYEEINGITWARLFFDDDVSDDDISIDFEGYETIGDGTGDLIEHPADQIKHFLTNFGFGRYKTGAWLTETTALDTTYQSAIETDLGLKRSPCEYKGARYIEGAEEQAIVLDEVDAWCQSEETKGVFTLQGKIGFGLDSFDHPGDVSLLPHLRRVDDEMASDPMKPTFPSRDAAKRIIGETAHSHLQGSYTERLMVLSQTATEESTDRIERPWGPSVLSGYFPMDCPGCMWWIKPQHMRDLADGDHVTLWKDEGGGRFDLVQPVPADGPTYVLDAFNGFPAIDFDGNQWLEGPADAGDVIISTHASMWFALNLRDVTTEQTIMSGGSNARLWIESGKLKAQNNGVTVQADITLGKHVVAWQHFGAEIRICVDSPFAENKAPSGDTASFGRLYIGKDAGGNHFNGQILEIYVHQFSQQNQSFAKLCAHGMRQGLTRGDTTERERDACSRRQNTVGERSRMWINWTAPLKFLDADLLVPFGVSHHQIPHPSGNGAGLDVWNRRLMNLLERVEDVQRGTLSLGLGDRTGISHMYRRSGVVEFEQGPRREGDAVSGLGVRHVFSHVNELFVEAPSGFVDQVLPGQDLSTSRGVEQHPLATPLLLRTSFQSGLSGITVSDPVGSITAEDFVSGEPRLFGTQRDQTDQGLNYEQITENFARFEAGSPHNADLTATWPLTVAEQIEIMFSTVANPTTIRTAVAHRLKTTDQITIVGHTGSTPSIDGLRTVTVLDPYTFTIPVNVTVAGTGGTFERLIDAGDVVCLSVDLIGDGGPLHFQFINEDGDYWDNTNKVFTGTPTWNPFPQDVESEGMRVRSEPIVWEGTSGQATVILGFPDGEVVDGGIVDVFHVQLEDNPFPTWRMVQDGTFLGPREATELTYFENTAAQMFNEPGFTIAMRITPPWNETDLASTTPGTVVDLWRVMYENPSDANYWRGGFDGGAGQRWFLGMKNALAETQAFQDTQMPVRDSRVSVVWRCTSSLEEWGLSEDTLTVFVNGVKGEDVQLGITRATPIANARVEFGLHAASATDIKWDWRVWSDEEAIAWSSRGARVMTADPSSYRVSGTAATLTYMP